VLVKTVTNAIKNGKPFHAYLLTGIRGIGKTSSARIIAKILNCSEAQIEGEDILPCEKCKSCLAIQEDSHPDVIELDAASKTGVNDVRELIDGSRYVPILSKYKVYIVDEVHMLSNSAFNALLKILEEPPLNVIFIFATTEFRKIPMTIISRCQKFDLHRFGSTELIERLKEVSDREGIAYTAEGLKEIAKYSEGALRDGLSILETVSMYKEKQRSVDEKLVREVLGVSDIECKYELFDSILGGDLKRAIDIINEIYYKGEDLSKILGELLWMTNSVSKIIAINGYFENLDLPEVEKTALRLMSKRTDLINLTSVWQIISKGAQELKGLSNKLQAIEMLMIRICYLSKLPSLEKIISGPHEEIEVPKFEKPAPPVASVEKSKEISSFNEVIELFRKNKEIVLYHQLMDEVELISFCPGAIEMRLSKALPNDFSNQISKKLEQWTRRNWRVLVSKVRGTPEKTVRSQEQEGLENKDGLVKDILESFPGARVKSVVGI